MHNSFIRVLLVSITLFLGVMSSRVIAQTNYDFTFTSETGSGQSVSGIFTVTGSTITGISGNVTGGGPGVIGKLKSAREHVADNVFSPTDPYLNASGVGFTTSPTSYFALFYDNASVYQLNGYYTSGGTLVSTTVSYGA